MTELLSYGETNLLRNSAWLWRKPLQCWCGVHGPVAPRLVKAGEGGWQVGGEKLFGALLSSTILLLIQKDNILKHLVNCAKSWAPCG